MPEKILKLYLIVLVLSGLSSCTNSREKLSSPITYQNIEKHISELSSDSYMGRMPMTQAETRVVDYLVSQMREIGLEGPNKGSFIQEVPILKVSSVLSPTLEAETPTGNLKLNKLTDYVAFSRKVQSEIILDKSEVVFAGFGIVAPEYKRNDYEGIDLKGKTVLVFVNDPGYGTNGDYFKGNAMTYYGRWTYKFEEAARQGAKACFIIHETGPAGYPWEVVSKNGETTRFYPQPSDGYRDRCEFEGWITLESAEKIFSMCGQSLKDVRKKAVSHEFKPFSLPLKFSALMKNSFENGVSKNVCGIIKGKTRPGEVIVYTAHWDHLGVGKPVNGDSIYNGASDNASAVSWLLEIARAFKAGPPPDRSVLFLSVTGEESGLLGSEYYVEHPFFSMNRTVAVINTDVVLFLGHFNDITLTGYGQSELDDWIAEAAARQGRYVAPDPNPENGMFFRSDQFPFVKKGVPAIFAKGNIDARKYGKEKTLDVLKKYWQSTYHSPDDEYIPGRDDLSGLVDDAILMYNVGYTMANSGVWPGWKEGSEFKSIRQMSLQSD